MYDKDIHPTLSLDSVALCLNIKKIWKKFILNLKSIFLIFMRAKETNLVKRVYDKYITQNFVI